MFYSDLHYPIKTCNNNINNNNNNDDDDDDDDDDDNNKWEKNRVHSLYPWSNFQTNLYNFMQILLLSIV